MTECNRPRPLSQRDLLRLANEKRRCWVVIRELEARGNGVSSLRCCLPRFEVVRFALSAVHFS